MSNLQSIKVPSRDELRRETARLASDGFTTIRDEGDAIVMSRKKKFNWLLAIVCLFIPVFGWIALIWMIVAAGRGSRVVEISIAPA